MLTRLSGILFAAQNPDVEKPPQSPERGFWVVSVMVSVELVVEPLPPRKGRGCNIS